MTDFQVGDKVRSKVGVVVEVYKRTDKQNPILIIKDETNSHYSMVAERLELVERLTPNPGTWWVRIHQDGPSYLYLGPTSDGHMLWNTGKQQQANLTTSFFIENFQQIFPTD